MKNPIILLLAMLAGTGAFAQENVNKNIFRQLTEELPTPNQYRTASGRPGPEYFQQKVDYRMEITLDEDANILSGKETISYHNNSPQTLTYLYLQLDQNVRENNSFGSQAGTSGMNSREHVSTFTRRINEFDGGFVIESLTDAGGNDYETIKNHTVMKVLLKEPLLPGRSTKMIIKWHYNINNMRLFGGRSGIDPFDEQGENVYAIAQFYPRLCVYNDVGWQIKQFMGASEFALEFGDFEVSITVPSDHIVAATGELQNSKEVLSAQMAERLARAKKSDKPVLIVTEEEAIANEKERSDGTKTWHFKALNVRDFAFASSRKFIWDAMSVPFENNNVLAMSFYEKESNPLWGRYSTKVIAHTLKSYSKHTFDYPYPVAQSIDCSLGMEYPMIAFNSGRPDPDGTYTKGTIDWVVGVVRHEVGHNYFPMIVNSDERMWGWMDEGINVFVQGIAERDWDINQVWSGMTTEMKGYMDLDKNRIVPLMTNADALLNGGMNAYRKPAVGLTILRETILGRELFDQAFKEYALTWMFKHPQPADFFRIMEDASGVDLDWFWRGWFFTTDNVDLSIDNVVLYEPVFDEETAHKAAIYRKENKPVHIATIRDSKTVSQLERDPSLKDKLLEPPSVISENDITKFKNLKGQLTPEELEQLDKGRKFYEITFKSHGGLIMPLIVEFEFEDGSREEIRIPAEIWMKNQKEVTKVFILDREVKNIILDPHIETADMDMSNNHWPRKTERIFFEIYK